MSHKRLLRLALGFIPSSAIFKNIIVVAFSLILFSFFPTEGIVEETTKGIFFLVLLPVLYIKFIARKKLSEFGLTEGNKEEGLFWGSAMLLLSLAIFYLLVQYTAFPQEYVKIMPRLTENFLYFIIYELILVNFLFFIQEAFFKGFLLSILTEKMGYLAIVLQAGIYSIPLLLISDNVWTALPMTVFSLTGGLVAFKSKTFLYSYLSGIIALIILDSYIIYLIK